MPSYEVTFHIETGIADATDTEITKTVQADDRQLAINLARIKLRRENPDIDHAKASAWNVQKVFV